MELNKRFSGDEKIEYVIGKIKKQSKVIAADVISAYNLFEKNNATLFLEAQKCLDMTFAMCKYMEPDAEDVIAMILCRDFLLGRIDQRNFAEVFKGNRSEQYYQSVVNARSHAPRLESGGELDCIRYYIMMRVCDKMFKRCNRALNHDHSTIGAGLVQNAYEKIKKIYGGKSRKTGEPYIVPQICVANILAEVGAESTVVAAAILQGVVDNVKYTFDDLENEFGKSISQFVEMLSAMPSASLEDCRSDLERKSENTAYADADRLMKAIDENMQMTSVLCIKAANIVYLLSCVDSVSEAESYDADNGVQREYVPMLKHFKLKYFLGRIEDLTWRAGDVLRYAEIEAGYAEMLSRNWECIDKFIGNLSSAEMTAQINKFAGLLGCAGYSVEVRRRNILPCDVYKRIVTVDNKANDINIIDKKTVPVCNIDIILMPRDIRSDYNTFVSCFLKAFKEKIALGAATVTDFEKDEDGNVVLEIEDRYRCIFRIRIIQRSDYFVYRTGIRTESSSADTEMCGLERPEKIIVFLRNGNHISIPKGSTVIDVAFAIHEEIGYTLKSALVNDSRVTIYKRLEHGDRIIVEADTYREDGETKKFEPHVRMEWLKWVATVRARNKIIDYLSYKYEGDNPRRESEVPTYRVEHSADKILSEIISQPL